MDRGLDATGFIAQEVLSVVEQFDVPYTGVVNTDDPNEYRVANSAFVPILVNAIKELDERLSIVEKST